MAPPSRVSTVSTLLNCSTNFGQPLTSFGCTWRERVGDVCGFRIRTGVVGGTLSIVGVENLSAVATAHRDGLCADGHTHVFLLLATEHVTNVDVFHSPETIHALRFHTDKRVSQWFGSCVGGRSRFDAPDGSFITALYGAVGTQLSLEERCGRVSAVYAPLDNAAKPRPEHAYARSPVLRSDETPSLVFETVHAEPRAVVVDVDGRMSDMTVVSADQYKRFVALDAAHGRATEHWFVLVDGERIEAVALAREKDVAGFRAVRFRTNLRTSIWFGKPSSACEVSWLEGGDHDDKTICRFQVEGVGSTSFTLVTGLGVVYTRPTDEGWVDGKMPAMPVDRASTAA